jgi:hypothetical protein
MTLALAAPFELQPSEMAQMPLKGVIIIGSSKKMVQQRTLDLAEKSPVHARPRLPLLINCCACWSAWKEAWKFDVTVTSQLMAVTTSI